LWHSQVLVTSNALEHSLEQCPEMQTSPRDGIIQASAWMSQTSDGGNLRFPPTNTTMGTTNNSVTAASYSHPSAHSFVRRPVGRSSQLSLVPPQEKAAAFGRIGAIRFGSVGRLNRKFQTTRRGEADRPSARLSSLD